MNRKNLICAALCVLVPVLAPLVSRADEAVRLAPLTIEAQEPVFPGGAVYDPDAAASSAGPFADSAEYLRSLPGVAAGRFGGHGLEPVIRGQSQGQINVVDDGAYVFGACPNRMDPPTAYINLRARDTVEISRGYSSVLNGFGGSGGSIVVTKAPPDFTETLAARGHIGGGYGGNGNMREISGQAEAGAKAGYARAYGSFKNAGSYEDGDGNRVRSAFEERSGGLALAYTPDDAMLSAGLDLHRIDDALFPGAGMDSPLSEGKTFRLGFERRLGAGPLEAIEARAYASLVDHVMDNYSLRDLTTPMARRVDSESDTYGIRLKGDLDAGGRPLEALLEWRRNNRNADRLQGASAASVDTLQSLLWPDITIDEIGFGLETGYDLDLATRLVTGIRYDHVRVDYGRAGVGAPGAGGRTPDDVYALFYGVRSSSQAEHNFGGLLRLEHDYTPEVLLYTGLSRSVRTADATERGLANFMGAGGAMSWVGNPEINPENHHQLDAGIEVRRQTLSYGVSVYANYVEDYILRDSARSQPGILVDFPNADIYRNIDAVLAGIELHGRWRLQEDWELYGDAAFTYGEDAEAGRALPQIPPLQGRLGADWQALPDLRLGGVMRWALEQTRADTDPLTGTGRDVDETNGYAVFDLTASWALNERASVDFGVANLLDETYASHLNRSNISDPAEVQVNEPGRSVFIRLGTRF